MIETFGLNEQKEADAAAKYGKGEEPIYADKKFYVRGHGAIIRSFHSVGDNWVPTLPQSLF